MNTRKPSQKMHAIDQNGLILIEGNVSDLFIVMSEFLWFEKK